MRYPSVEKRELARSLRRRSTASEELAWDLIRGRRLLDLKFRRQHVIVGFVVDFASIEAKLVIEIDGGVHDEPERQQLDAERTVALTAAGWRVVRINAADVSFDALTTLVAPFVHRGVMP